MTQVKECFAEIEPLLSVISNTVMRAPLEPEDKAGLAIMVMAHFMGTACGALQASRPELENVPIADIAEEVGKLAVEVVKSGDIARAN